MGKKKALAIVSIILVVIIIFAVTGLGHVIGSYGFPWYVGNVESSKTEFSKEKWNSDWENRIHMMEDLENRYDLEGMNKDEIFLLLGENVCADFETYVIYTLGQKGGRLFDYMLYLEITFDENGNVEETRVRTG